MLTATYTYLSTAEPVDQREADSIEQFNRELARLSDPCSETADIVHVTASSIVLGIRGIVLHRHKRLGIWLQPGGHIDANERPEDAALREAFEETGIQAAHYFGEPKIVHVDAHPGPRGHTHLDLRFLLWAPDVDPNPPEGESQDVAWFSPADAILQAPTDLNGILSWVRDNYARLVAQRG
jgi:8-oxo-dGTP pyrophosphatase MutT (NUDIX family)